MVGARCWLSFVVFCLLLLCVVVVCVFLLIGVDSFVAPCLLFVVCCFGLFVARRLALSGVVCLLLSAYCCRLIVVRCWLLVVVRFALCFVYCCWRSVFLFSV